MTKTTLVITKNQIIKAIKTETRLMHGEWIGRTYYNGNVVTVAEKEKRRCNVCAVGAVLCNISAPSVQLTHLDNWAIRAIDSPSPARFAEYEEEAKLLVSDGDYWSALSTFFEGASMYAEDHPSLWKSNKARLESIRNRTIQFVKDYFPNEVTLTTFSDEIKPRRGIKKMVAP